MKMRTFATSVALIGLVLSPPAALAEAGSSDCSHLARQVTAALEANADSPNYRAAKIEAGNGRTLCDANEFDMGVAHYQKALDLLGVAH
jgi:hypothetical protein